MKKVLFVMPPTPHAHLPHFKSRFELLSEHVESHVLFTGDAALDGSQAKGIYFYVQPYLNKFSLLEKVSSAVSMIIRAVHISKKHDIDYVWAYDPLTLGFVAICVKLILRCKVVIEINGHLKNAKDAGIASVNISAMKRIIFNFVSFSTLLLADVVKILNHDQFNEWKTVLKHKPCFMFHDFVPTGMFSPGRSDDGYILCVGYPFRRKGVDILLHAFDSIRENFPGVRLLIIGHCREPELSSWRDQVAAVPGAELCKPVQYDDMQEVLRNSRLVVLPSRSEAMGRVLIEAMACGKAVVGTRVGGIPNIIQDGICGLLAEPEDVNDLAGKIRMLLEDGQLRRKMEEAGLERSKTILSDGNYVCSVCKILDSLDKSCSCHAKGIVYSVF